MVLPGPRPNGWELTARHTPGPGRGVLILLFPPPRPRLSSRFLSCKANSHQVLESLTKEVSEGSSHR